MPIPIRTVVIGLVVAMFIATAFDVMLRSRRYEDQPRRVRWAWTVVFSVLAVVAGLLWFSIPP